MAALQTGKSLAHCPLKLLNGAVEHWFHLLAQVAGPLVQIDAGHVDKLFTNELLDGFDDLGAGLRWKICSLLLSWCHM